MQPKDSTGKEKEVHLVELNPINNATEYSKVVDEIKKTASVTITKIERVQNPGLYRAYLVKRDQMDQKNGSNEKFLFHGTAKGSCSSINTFGFNRSYCGKNGRECLFSHGNVDKEKRVRPENDGPFHTILFVPVINLLSRQSHLILVIPCFLFTSPSLLSILLFFRVVYYFLGGYAWVKKLFW